MKCKKCKKEVNHSNSLNVNDKRFCAVCAYNSFPKGAPARVQLERHFDNINNGRVEND